jgi:RNA polymerase sigma-70 factor (ECF subfamily)
MRWPGVQEEAVQIAFAPTLTMTDVLSQPDALRAAQEGDLAAFEVLYRAHVGKVYALCLRLTGSRADAEAATQDAFARAWERLGTFRGDASFRTWIHRIAVNIVLKRHRDTTRRLRRVETVEDLERLDPPAPGAHPEARLDLERAIAALPEGARIVFVLYEIEGYSHAEIAGQLGVSENTSKAQLHRARHILRGALE